MAKKDRPRPAPLSPEAKRARKPPPPDEMVGALQDRAHKEDGKLIAAVPIKVRAIRTQTKEKQ